MTAYEPDPELAALVQQNARSNWFADRVSVRQVAAADQTGKWAYMKDDQLRGLSSAVAPDEVPGMRSSTSIRAERLDEVFDGSLPIRLVKVDVEGGEWRVLAGMTRLLEIGAIEFVDVEVIREIALDAWPALVHQLRLMVDEHGGSPHLLAGDGSLVPASLDRLIATAGHHPHVVFKFPQPVQKGSRR